MASQILIAVSFLAMALLPAFVGTDTRDGRDWQAPSDAPAAEH
ncbi:MAG TPA: hypothetical protein VG266_05945 [Candidatus Dormibacteraeota bacterium]|jgi:hypothetical protein|nr:hypothetical protein [Candidatus Dormibacteraeota bacterium]